MNSSGVSEEKFMMKLGSSSYCCRLKTFEYPITKEFVWSLKIEHPVRKDIYRRTFTERSCCQITGKQDNESFFDIIKAALADSSQRLVTFNHFFIPPPIPETFEYIESRKGELCFENPLEEHFILVLKISANLPISITRKKLKVTYWITLPVENRDQTNLLNKYKRLENKIKNSNVLENEISSEVDLQSQKLENIKSQFIKDKKETNLVIGKQQKLIKDLIGKTRRQEVIIKELFEQVKNQNGVITELVNRFENIPSISNHESKKISILEFEVEGLKKKLSNYYSSVVERKKENLQSK